MEKEQYIPQELFEHYDIKLFDINRTNNVYDLILKMWNENKELREQNKPVKTFEEGIVKGFSHNIKTVEELEERINKAIEYMENNLTWGRYRITKILKGEEEE